MLLARALHHDRLLESYCSMQFSILRMVLACTSCGVGELSGNPLGEQEWMLGVTARHVDMDLQTDVLRSCIGLHVSDKREEKVHFPTTRR